MRRLLTVAVTFFSAYCYSQGLYGAVNFEYDSAGNQKTRELEICLNCGDRTGSQENSSFKKIEENSESTLTYFPNPVSEQLQLQWQNLELDYITAIDLYTLSGQKMYTSNFDFTVTETVLDFTPYAAGIYNLLVTYKNGDIKTVKIVKK